MNPEIIKNRILNIISLELITLKDLNFINQKDIKFIYSELVERVNSKDTQKQIEPSLEEKNYKLDYLGINNDE